MPQEKFSKRQWLMLMIIGLADFGNGICVSLVAPFFPREAEEKGCTATVYGLIMGIFELITFIVSPIFGQYINQIGPNLLFCTGIFTSGATTILFGFIDHINERMTFIITAFVIRIIGAIGNAAFLISSFSFIGEDFPNNVATTFATLASFGGVGLLIGLMVGAALYTVGGYFLPFAVLGCTLIITGFISLCVLPKRHYANADKSDGHRGPSMISLLRIPSVMICTITIIATSASIAFITATLEPHVRQFNLSPLMVGLLFVLSSGIYALTAPIWGWLVDKYIHPKFASLLGTVLVAVSFLIIGPVWFIPLDAKLNYVILALIINAIGVGALLVSTFTDALHCAIKEGFPDSIETYGLIAGLWNSAFALGAFIGPSVGGFLYDFIGFRKAIFFIVVLHGTVGLLIILFLNTIDNAQ